MERVSLEVLTACIDRLLRAWSKPVGIKSQDFARELADLMQVYSTETVQRATVAALDECHCLPSRASMRKYCEQFQEREVTVKRYVEYKPPQIARRYPREDQSHAEKTDFLNSVLSKYGFGPVGSVLKRM